MTCVGALLLARGPLPVLGGLGAILGGVRGLVRIGGVRAWFDPGQGGGASVAIGHRDRGCFAWATGRS
jgi:hypothetical protein